MTAYIVIRHKVNRKSENIFLGNWGSRGSINPILNIYNRYASCFPKNILFEFQY